LALLAELPRRGAELSADPLRAGIAACRRGSRWEQSLQLFADSRQHAIPAAVRTYSVALFALGRADRYAMTRGAWRGSMRLFYEDLVAQGLEPDREAYNSALVNCPGHLWQLALRMINEMCERNLTPSTLDFTSAISACHRGREWKPVLVLVKQMRAAGVHLDLQVYNAALWAFRRGDQWRLALDLFGWMRRSTTITPDVVTYNSVIHTCTVEGNWCRALQLWFQMQNKRITPDWDTYTALLRVSEHCERWEWSRQLMDTLYKLDAPRNAEIYNAAINACRRSGRWDMAMGLFRDMRADGVDPDTKTYAYLTDVLEEGGRFDLAMRLMDQASAGT